MQGIITKYLGPTTHNCSRIKVKTSGSKPISMSVSYDAALSTYDNHAKAAAKLAERLAWYGRWFSCDLNNSGYVFVRVIFSNDPDFIVDPQLPGEPE